MSQKWTLRDFRLPPQFIRGILSSGMLRSSCCTRLPTFRHRLPVPSSRVKRSKSCPETSANNYQHTLRNNPEERRPKIYYFDKCSFEGFGNYVTSYRKKKSSGFNHLWQIELFVSILLLWRCGQKIKLSLFVKGHTMLCVKKSRPTDLGITRQWDDSFTLRVPKPREESLVSIWCRVWMDHCHGEEKLNHLCGAQRFLQSE